MALAPPLPHRLLGPLVIQTLLPTLLDHLAITATQLLAVELQVPLPVEVPQLLLQPHLPLAVANRLLLLVPPVQRLMLLLSIEIRRLQLPRRPLPLLLPHRLLALKPALPTPRAIILMPAMVTKPSVCPANAFKNVIVI